MSNDWNTDPPHPYDESGKVDPPARRTRRQAIKSVVGVAVVGAVGYFGWTKLLIPRGPGSGGSGRRTALGKSSQFDNAKQPVKVTIEGQEAFVDSVNGILTVISGVCTHQGCPVDWDAAKNQYNCPCHNSWFDRTGQIISGPAKKPLPPIRHEVEDGILYADA